MELVAAWRSLNSRRNHVETTILSRVRVLVAQDNPDIQRFLCIVLRQSGAEATVVDDGQKAVDSAIARPFDVILMDIDMPVVDGLEATRRLRDRGYQGAIIALTASGVVSAWTAVPAGFNGHLRQPIGTQHLVAALASFAMRGTTTTLLPRVDQPHFDRHTSD